MHYHLVTTYKHRAYFPEMLASIRMQYDSLAEFEREARILVLDDASPDGTVEVVQELSRTHSNISLFVNEVNKGIGYNRNFLLNWLAGLGPATSDFVQFVDGDDILPKKALEAKLRAFAAEPALQVVGGQLELFYENDLETTTPVLTFPVDPQVQAIANLFECHFYVSNALFRASVFLDPTVRFPETVTGEDWLFFSLFPLRKRHIQEVTLKYRRHSNNITSTMTNTAQVFSLRRQARSLGLLRIALFPSDRDCELLDMVGYLSFRLSWFGAEAVYRPDVSMPWFSLLPKRPEVMANWPALRAELQELFLRIQAHNFRVAALDPSKLRSFFAAVMAAAEHEIGKASQPQVEVGIGSLAVG